MCTSPCGLCLCCACWFMEVLSSLHAWLRGREFYLHSCCRFKLLKITNNLWKLNKYHAQFVTFVWLSFRSVHHQYVSPIRSQSKEHTSTSAGTWREGHAKLPGSHATFISTRQSTKRMLGSHMAQWQPKQARGKRKLQFLLLKLKVKTMILWVLFSNHLHVEMTAERTSVIVQGVYNSKLTKSVASHCLLTFLFIFCWGWGGFRNPEVNSISNKVFSSGNVVAIVLDS